MKTSIRGFSKVIVTGKLYVVHDQIKLGHDVALTQPVLVEINNKRFILLFDTEAQLRAEMTRLNIDKYIIKQVLDGKEFSDSIYAGGYGIMVNPVVFKNQAGKEMTKWTQLEPDKSGEN
jgi:hypothetical protein